MYYKAALQKYFTFASGRGKTRTVGRADLYDKPARSKSLQYPVCIHRPKASKAIL